MSIQNLDKILKRIQKATHYTGGELNSAVKNPDDVKDSKVREKYGVLGGVLGIVCNLVLFVIKLVIGLMVNAIAIMFKFMNEYYKRMGSLECLPLKRDYYEQELPRCTKMMITAAEVLEEIIEEYSKYYKINR